MVPGNMQLSILHIVRSEQPVVDYLRQRLAVDFFSDETEKRIVGVVVNSYSLPGGKLGGFANAIASNSAGVQTLAGLVLMR